LEGAKNQKKQQIGCNANSNSGGTKMC
jgi:hypothetical protein